MEKKTIYKIKESWGFFTGSGAPCTGLKDTGYAFDDEKMAQDMANYMNDHSEEPVVGVSEYKVISEEVKTGTLDELKKDFLEGLKKEGMSR